MPDKEENFGESPLKDALDSAWYINLVARAFGVPAEILMEDKMGETIKDCEWHKDEIPYYTDADDVPYCPECGRMIAVKECEACHDTFMDWSYTGYDDIVAGPGATRQGDFCCSYCLPFIEAELEQQEMEDAEELGFGLYDDLP